ncbi:hypothetical protein SeMB42_g02975 [Synchytrium endobioticum]|uniref:Nucleoporin Nup54 alpha-helical domain-containing protein n=1 Tax=Synchytrium endobioticum TaxID=286115 RepID=A0A507DBT6_9FUNG|nr:hypothetical protein SeMB42_g02975 [Synchytrium endobioticum]TPX49043.1 hypothetical protein SeLEV6574_g01713 [Synchytrium endobioticum]
MFGQPATSQPPSSNMFGQTAVSQPPSSNMFGQPVASQPPSSNMFGQPVASQPPSFNLFGQPVVSQPPSSNLFGQPAASQAPSLGAFGTFGAQQHHPAQPALGIPLLGGNAAAPSMGLGSGAFGGGPGGFGASTMNQQQQQVQQEDWKNPRDVDTAQRIVRSHLPRDMMDQLWMTKQLWDPASKFFIFRHYLLNFVQPSEVKLYQPSENDYMFAWMEKRKSIPQDLADKAVPVQIFGFEGLDNRCRQQRDNNAIHARQVQNLESRVSKMKNHQYLDTTMRLTAYQRKNAELASRIARLMAYSQILRNRSTSIKPEEEAFKARIDAINQRLAHETQIRARIMELGTLIEHMRDDRMDVSTANAPSNGNVERAIAGDVDQLKDVLQEHEKWLASLTAIVKTDTDSVDKIVGDYAEILAPSTSSG